jgi:protein involved in polysaccharide export with SLBB domain
MPRLAVITLVALACALSGACGDPPPSEYPTQRVYVEDTSLGAGDEFQVRVFRQDDLSNTYRVGSGGTISFPLIGEVEVAGRSPDSVQEEIRTRLADGYLVNPQVSLIVTEYRSKQISVFGQVGSPGTIPYADGMTIIEAISRAGGFTEMARQNAVTVTRKNADGDADGGNVRYTIPVADIRDAKAPTFFVRPGDVIHVPERLF